MKINNIKNILLLVCLLILCSGVQAGIRKSNLKILYVGGSPDLYTRKTDSRELIPSVNQRMAAFEKMLKEYFRQVTVIHAKDYTARLSNDYDVTIMDGIPTPIEPAGTIKDDLGRFSGYRKAVYLPQNFDRPMLMIAEMSSEVGGSIGLKADWLCLCLDADAHHIRTSHPIFKGPFPVKMSLVMKPTPKEGKALASPEEGIIPDSILMWQVQKDGYKTKNGMRPGMISRRKGFEDSPDAEFISGGVSAKTLDATAIGRHGNFLHWGFSASPADMTEEAKSIFANAIVYISQFAGQTPIARKYDQFLIQREEVRSFAYRATRNYYQHDLEIKKKYDRIMAETKQSALAKQVKGEKLDEMEQVSLTKTPRQNSTYEESLQHLYPDLYVLYGTDENAYKDYYTSNAGYFMPRPGRISFILDEDARSLGIPNNDIRLLDQAIRMLEQKTDVAKGLRLLKRYTLCRFETPSEWRNWFETNKSRLFFTETGGWFFLVNTYDKNIPGNDYSVLNIRPVNEQTKQEKPLPAETNEKNPVWISANTDILPNGNREITIRIKIHPGYHIYAKVAKSDPYLPTTIDFRLPKGVEKAGHLKQPSGRTYNNAGTVVLDNEVAFRQEIQGTGEITCIVSYQCCNDQICMQPEEVELTVK